MASRALRDKDLRVFLRRRRRRGTVEPPPLAQFLAETLDLLAAIREDRPTEVPIEEGVRSLRFVLAAAQSAEEGTPVDVPSSI